MWIEVWNHQYFENIAKKLFFGFPENFTIGLCTCSSLWCGSLVNLNVPFKLILRRFEVVLWCLEWECYTFNKRLMKIHSNSVHFITRLMLSATWTYESQVHNKHLEYLIPVLLKQILNGTGKNHVLVDRSRSCIIVCMAECCERVQCTRQENWQMWMLCLFLAKGHEFPRLKNPISIVSKIAGYDIWR